VERVFVTDRTSKGGMIDANQSLETMTPEERSARAKKASLAAAKKRTAKRLAASKRARKYPQTKK